MLDLLISRVIRGVIFYYVITQLYQNLFLLKMMYVEFINEYTKKMKHNVYVYDCYYASCYYDVFDETRLICKCILEKV